MNGWKKVFHANVSKNKTGLIAAAATKSLQSCPTLCDRMDCSLPGSSIHGIFQARVLQWGAIAFPRGNSYYTAIFMKYNL